MPYPEWVSRHRRAGTELRLIRGHYYLYQVSSRWNPEKKRAQKITGKLLGKITQEQGFLPSVARTVITKPLQQKEYGASHMVFHLFPEILEALKNYFPNEHKAIAAVAFFRLAYQSSLKMMNFYLTQCFLSEIHPDLSLMPKEVSQLLRKIGTQRETITAFFKSFIRPGHHLLMDITHLHSHSPSLSLANTGYNSQRNFDPQVNLLLIFSQQLFSPVYYRLLPGNIRDVKAFKLSLKESGVEDAILIADKGFYSDSNVLQLDEARLSYLLPLKRNHSLVDYAPLEEPSKKGMQGYFKFNNRYVWYHHYSKNGKKLFLFLDEILKTNEEKDYLNRIETHPEEYSFQDFQKKNLTFGTFAILTNVSFSAEQIYSTYKSRIQVEILADTLKNFLHADRTYMRDDYALEGWMFVNYIALLWYYSIYRLLVQHKLLTQYSPHNLLQHLTDIKKIYLNPSWHLTEMTRSTQQLLTKLNIHIT